MIHTPILVKIRENIFGFMKESSVKNNTLNKLERALENQEYKSNFDFEKFEIAFIFLIF